MPPGFKGRSEQRKGTTTFVEHFEKATIGITRINSKQEIPGHRKSLFLKALADNHKEIMNKPETNILLNALQSMKDVE
jgi:hypothetical protein